MFGAPIEACAASHFVESIDQIPALLGSFRDTGDVAELAAFARLFAVVVQVKPIVVERSDAIGYVADQVDHAGVRDRGRGSERLAGDRLQVIRELARLGALDGPVAGVMDPRRDFVGKQRSIRDKQLECQHADVVEVIE